MAVQTGSKSIYQLRYGSDFPLEQFQDDPFLSAAVVVVQVFQGRPAGHARQQASQAVRAVCGPHPFGKTRVTICGISTTLHGRTIN